MINDLRWRHGIDFASLDIDDQRECAAWWHAMRSEAHRGR